MSRQPRTAAVVLCSMVRICASLPTAPCRLCKARVRRRSCATAACAHGRALCTHSDPCGRGLCELEAAGCCAGEGVHLIVDPFHSVQEPRSFGVNQIVHGDRSIIVVEQGMRVFVYACARTTTAATTVVELDMREELSQGHACCCGHAGHIGFALERGQPVRTPSPTDY